MPKNSKALSNSRVVARQMEEAATYSPRIIGNSNDGVSWDLFKWVVGALMALIVTLVTLYFTGAKDDLTAVRKDFGNEITEVRREISDTKLNFARSVADVEKQLGTTNGKLEMLSQRH